METLEDKCRAQQKAFDYTIDTNKFVLCHIDGRSFSKKIKNKFEKPFDDNFIHMMNEVAVYLCQSIQGAQFAYVQSDEITLVLKKLNPEGDIFFGGRLCKMQSIIASLATSKFMRLMIAYEIAETGDVDVEEGPLYQFDCKVWTVDTPNDVMAWLLFRNIDCVRNSKQQTAQTYLPHKSLLNFTTDEQIEILKNQKGIFWHDFDDGKKYGRIVMKVVVEGLKELSNGNEAHFTRSKWKVRPFFDLTITEHREALKERFPFLKGETEDGTVSQTDYKVL